MREQKQEQLYMEMEEEPRRPKLIYKTSIEQRMEADEETFEGF